MPYKFTFDLTSLPRSFFQELVKSAYESGLHQRMGDLVRSLIKKFKIEEITGLNILEAVSLLEDFIEIEALNLASREAFRKAPGRRALLLPHCARKYMDSRCKAVFDPKVPTYLCESCSPDCLINQASKIARERGYDVYVLPGGSCIPKILSSRSYSAVVGVACGAELKLGHQVLRKFGIIGQAIPLLKNGCAETWFDLEELKRVL